jgi:glycosyltransferase involved in cell wall biosynthesis
MKKVLIVTYYWPPGSGAGVQRWLKFSKYISLSGWEPLILTVDPGYATYPAVDNSLEGDIPPGLRIYRTKATDYFRLYKKDKSKIPSAGFAVNGKKGFPGKISRFIRGNFFIPDPRKGWNRYALRKACELIENEGISYLITTSPPHSTQLVGLRLKKRYPDIKWIADLRDPWTDIYYYDEFFPLSLARKIDSGYEKKVLESADRIITVGQSLKKLFASKIPGLSDKISVICNGYDEEDFHGTEASKPGIFTISYTGTLSGSYPLNGFLKALSLFKEKGGNYRLRFTGAVSEEQKKLITSTEDKSAVEFNPYADHRKAIGYMMDSSALLLIIPDHRSNRSIITGKLFEYLATGLPVICLGPADGDAAEIIDYCGNGKTFDYEDSDGILKYIEFLGTDHGTLVKQSPGIFRRDILARKIVSMLEEPEK